MVQPHDTGLRCYVCGQPISGEMQFTLISMSRGVDRVFVIHTLCDIRVAVQDRATQVEVVIVKVNR